MALIKTLSCLFLLLSIGCNSQQDTVVPTRFTDIKFIDEMTGDDWFLTAGEFKEQYIIDNSDSVRQYLRRKTIYNDPSYSYDEMQSMSLGIYKSDELITGFSIHIDTFKLDRPVWFKKAVIVDTSFSNKEEWIEARNKISFHRNSLIVQGPSNTPEFLKYFDFSVIIKTTKLDLTALKVKITQYFSYEKYDLDEFKKWKCNGDTICCGFYFRNLNKYDIDSEFSRLKNDEMFANAVLEKYEYLYEDGYRLIYIKWD